jgi:hypothetical protein
MASYKSFFCFVVTILSIFISSIGIAASLSHEEQAEVSQLFNYLGKSDCQFNRNGKWHDGAKAVDHLKKKYRYLTQKGLISSVESFIERGASESSMSGKPYMVRCGGDEPIKSSVWFLTALERLRANDL